MTSRTIRLDIPTLHADQSRAYLLPGRFKAFRCGRRWGKTALLETIAETFSARRRRVGWFAPEHKYWSEAYNDIIDVVEPIKTASSKSHGIIRTIGGGRTEFWSLTNDRAGRSRKYHIALIDEAAFTAPNMMDIWNKSIRPTLLDYGGYAIVASNTAGVDYENFFWRICNEPEHGFVQYHAPTHNNPLLPPEEVAKLERENHPLVYAQEYLAEFVDWTGVAFFERDKMLVANPSGTYEPLEHPQRLDAVYAVIDTAIKAGQENDGTGCVYFGYSRTSPFRVTLLDYELVQIEGASLEVWLPTVFQNLEALAARYGARMGSQGAFIEDSNAGTILLQKAANKRWNARALPSDLAGLGKDGRAIAVSGYVYRGMVKFTRHAFDKVVPFKMHTRNHLLSQVLSFRVGDKDAAKRADDLLDCFCYGVAIALGDAKGF